MEIIGKLLFFSGFVLAVVTQLYIAARAFRKNTVEGLCCFVIPAYILYYAMRRKTRQPKSLIMWGSGIAVLVIGMYLISM